MSKLFKNPIVIGILVIIGLMIVINLLKKANTPTYTLPGGATVSGYDPVTARYIADQQLAAANANAQSSEVGSISNALSSIAGSIWG